jgi:ribosomal protein L31
MPSDDKSSHCFWQGELKKKKKSGEIDFFFFFA